MRYRGLLRGFAIAGLLLLATRVSPLLAKPASAQASRITLDQALDLARHANATLPVAQKQVEGALARARQARGDLYPNLSVIGDLHAGTPQDYASNDGLLQLSAQAPLYDGGQLRAGVARSKAEVASSRAGYRMAVRDVEYAVRLAYGRVLHAESTLSFRRRGIDRLQAYLVVVQSRAAAGQGIGADVLGIRQRIASARADLATVDRDLHESMMGLNDLMGRAPEAPLSLAPLPAPAVPAKAGGEPWMQSPDVQQAEQDVQATKAGIEATRAGRKPHVSLEANVGTQPSFGNGPSPYNNGTGSGAEVLLTFKLPLWDKGVYAGRLAEANAALEQAEEQHRVVTRAAHLAWASAASDLDDLFTEYRARKSAADVARDAYLQAESLYRGGQGTALAVLDAYDAWIGAVQARLDAVYNYRAAEAQLARWGTQ